MALASAGLALTVGLSGCAGSSSSSQVQSGLQPGAGSKAVAASPPEAVAAAGVLGQDAAAGAAQPASGARATAPAVAPKLARRATLTIRAGAVDTAVIDARAAVAAAGGDVVSERVATRVGSDARPTQNRAELVLSVPADKLDATITALSKLGDVLDRTASTEDVTTTYVDLDSRVKTMRASIERVRALMGKATRISEVVQLESELARREADLESLSGQLASLSARVARSTITLTVQADSPTPTSDGPSFGAALASGWATFVRSMYSVFAAIGWLLPWLVLVAIVGWPVRRWVQRRRTQRRTQAAASAGPGTEPAIRPEPAPAADPHGPD